MILVLLWRTIRISELIMTMQLNSKAIFVAYLMLVSLCAEGKLIIFKQIQMCVSQIAFIQRRNFTLNLCIILEVLSMMWSFQQLISHKQLVMLFIIKEFDT